MAQLVHQDNGRRLTPNIRAKRGFTLIEVLVTLVILAVGMLASIIGIMGALDHNMLNEMRNDAIKIAQEQMEAARNMPYANIQNIGAQNITRQVRKASVTYQVQVNAASTLSGANLGMSVVRCIVNWSHKNVPHTYVLQSIVRQAK